MVISLEVPEEFDSTKSVGQFVEPVSARPEKLNRFPAPGKVEIGWGPAAEYGFGGIAAAPRVAAFAPKPDTVRRRNSTDSDVRVASAG